MSEPLTIREQAIQALEVKTNAQRGVDSYDERDLPLTVLFEGADEPARIQYGFVETAMSVRLERMEAGQGAQVTDNGLETTGETDKRKWHTQANALLGDLIQSATGGDNTLGGLCQGIEYVSGGTAISPDGSNTVVAFADIRVRYRFLIGNPFSSEVE